MRVSFVTLIGCAVLLLGWYAVKCSAASQVPPPEEAKQSLSVDGTVPGPSRLPDDGLLQSGKEGIRVAMREDGDHNPAVNEPPQVKQDPVDPGVRDRVDIARSLGIIKSAFQLKTPGAWDEFARTWDETTANVNRAHDERVSIGRKIAGVRFKEGKCDTIMLEEKDRGKDGGFGGTWQNLRHPDEFLSTNYDYRPGGGQKITQVRIAPGENLDMDNATLSLRLAQDMRRDAILSLIKEAK